MDNVYTKDTFLYLIRNHKETEDERKDIIRFLGDKYRIYKKISNKYDVPFFNEYEGQPIVGYTVDDLGGFTMTYTDIVGNEYYIKLSSEMVFEDSFISKYENDCRNKYINKYINIIDKNTKTLDKALRDIKNASQKLNDILC